MIVIKSADPLTVSCLESQILLFLRLQGQTQAKSQPKILLMLANMTTLSSGLALQAVSLQTDSQKMPTPQCSESKLAILI